MNPNKRKTCLGLRFYSPIFSRVGEISLQWHQQAFTACGLPKIDPKYPRAHLQGESVSDTWQLFLEMCSVIHTAHSSCAVGVIGLRMTRSPPSDPRHQLGKLPWDTFFILSSLETLFRLYPWCPQPWASLERQLCLLELTAHITKILQHPLRIKPSMTGCYTCVLSSHILSTFV